jgi:hypothetical protein
MVKHETVLQVEHILMLLRDIDFENECCNKKLVDIRKDLVKLLTSWVYDLGNYDEF